MELDREASKLRFEREKYWINTLQTANPFSLNSRVEGIPDFNPSQGNLKHFVGGRRKKRHNKRKPKRYLERKITYIFLKAFLYGTSRSDLHLLLKSLEYRRKA